MHRLRLKHIDKYAFIAVFFLCHIIYAIKLVSNIITHSLSVACSRCWSLLLKIFCARSTISVMTKEREEKINYLFCLAIKLTKWNDRSETHQMQTEFEMHIIFWMTFKVDDRSVLWLKMMAEFHSQIWIRFRLFAQCKRVFTEN